MKSVLMVMPHMVGGGAERVAALLMNYFHDNHIDTEFVLTDDFKDDVIRCDLGEETPLYLLKEAIEEESFVEKIKLLPTKISSKIVCNLYERFGKSVPAYWAHKSMIWQHHREIGRIRDMMIAKPEMTVIAFLQPAIPIVLLAARGLPNKVIISERCDPNRLMGKRYGRPFIEEYYNRVDAAVFQTEDAQLVYPANVREKGTVIFNPIKVDLPEPYVGKRNNIISTFCRISEQKNLPMLIEAFNLLHVDYPGYKLRIIGDAPNEEGARVIEAVKNLVDKYKLDSVVELLPFSSNVHEDVLEDAMYVNTSDYEGISNAMLEAMAIGLPVVCTDCPIGGAKDTIEDGINGLLVPVGDAEATCLAMKRIIEDENLAETLSVNASKLRNQLSLKHIAQKWMELL